MKKKLFISTHTLNIGGVERSFLGLLENLDYAKVDVDVFVYQHGGELFHLLPKEVNLLPEIRDYALLLEPVSNAVKERKWGIVYSKLAARFKTKFKEFALKRNSEKNDSIAHPVLYKTALPFMPDISEQKYDAVLAFLHPNFFETSKVKAAKHLAWIHTDYSFLNVDRNLERKMWKKNEYIFAVSEANQAAFCEVFPELKNRVSVFENILSENFVTMQSEAEDVSKEMPNVKGQLKFLSIGRFSYPKNFENIPYIAAGLKAKGLDFVWFIIGYGAVEEESKIKEAIRNTGCENQVKILGKKTNPYPYIKACDVYVQPSRFEGKAVTVREAQMLGKPVMITDFPSSHSQLKNKYDGWIVPMENEKAATAIYSLVTDKNELEKIIGNCRREDYSNVSEIQKIYDIADV